MVASDPFFNGRREQIVALASRPDRMAMWMSSIEASTI
jgi:hypothetical protein